MPKNPPFSIATRLALAEDRLDGQYGDLARHDKQIELLLGDRALFRQVARTVNELRRTLPELAEQAASKVLAATLEHRELLDRELRGERRAEIGLRFQMISLAIGLAGFLFGLYALIHH